MSQPGPCECWLTGQQLEWQTIFSSCNTGLCCYVVAKQLWVLQAVGFQVWLPHWWTPDQMDWALTALDHEPPALAPAYHGQDGEDEYAYKRFFINQRGGAYLEIGGNDGSTFSNTLFFRY